MYDVPVDGLRLLSEVDITTAAGGLQPNLPNEGGGGPSAAEAIIEAMFENWSAPLSSGGDEWTSYMADNAMFWDRDENGYYDYIEISSDAGICVYDPEKDVWVWKGFVGNGVTL